MSIRQSLLILFGIFSFGGLWGQSWQWGGFIESGYSSIILEQRPSYPVPPILEETGRTSWQVGIQAHTVLLPGLSWRPQLNLAYLNNQLSFFFGDDPAREADLRSIRLSLASLFEFQSPNLPAAPFVFLGPQINAYLPIADPSTTYLVLDRFSLSAILGLGFEFPLASVRLRPAVHFDLGLSSRLRGADDREVLEAFGELRQDRIGVRLGVLF